MTKKETKQNKLTTIKEITEKLLKLLKISQPTIEAKEEGETILLKLDSPDRGLLIGNNGETVASLQLILSLMLYKKLGSWEKLVVNVADFLEKREENLTRMALNTAQRVKFSQKEMIMPFLNSAERRIVHLSLQDHPDVKTESVGEGRDRRLIIKPKN